MFHYIFSMGSSAILSLVLVRGVEAARDPWAEATILAVLGVSYYRAEYFLGREYNSFMKNSSYTSLGCSMS